MLLKRALIYSIIAEFIEYRLLQFIIIFYESIKLNLEFFGDTSCVELS